MRQIIRTLLAVMLFCLALPSVPAAAAPTPPPPEPVRHYSETGHNIAVALLAFYDTHGGIGTFGLPLTEVMVDESGMQVQYFERARFELHPAWAPDQRVALSLAGSLLTSERALEPPFQWLTATLNPNLTFFPEAGHSLGGAFRYFWELRGALTVFGYPISEEFYELNPTDGQRYLVQYFQRARFEYHPENIGTPYEVLLGQLGRELLTRSPLAQAATAPVPPLTLIGKAITGYRTSASERRHNIARATAMFNGLVVQPQVEFSFNAVGDFSETNGFVDGYAIIGGKLEKVVGGGLCQVSTTLFRAVSNAGLQITQRQGHSYIVYFYENILGFDATVFTPDLDFRWRNDSATPVYLQTESNPDAATVTFSLWGISDGRSVTYAGPYERNWVQPGTPIWQLDPTLAPNATRQLVHGRPGVDVRYLRTVTMPDGSIRFHDTYTTNYKPWEDFFIYGSGVTPPEGVRVLSAK